MKIEITANKPLVKYYLKNLKDEIFNFTNKEEFDLPPGWYNFILEYTGENIELTSIKVNDEDLRQYFYAGFFTEKATRKRLQPASAVWTEGYYSIWLHTEFGHMESFYMDNIRNTDYADDKFKSYLHTVDRVIDIDPIWPERIKSYFRAGHGPGWWKKRTLRTPYEVVPPEAVNNIDRQKIIHDMYLDCPLVIDKDVSHFGKQDGKTKILHRELNQKHAHLPFTEIKDIKSTELRKLCEQIGFTRMLYLTLQVMPAGGCFKPHIDDLYHYDPYKVEDAVQYTMGPSVFMFNLQEQGAEGNQFKLGPAGLIPINEGVFFNQSFYSHASINNSDYDRPMLILQGDRNIDYNY